MEQAFDPKCLPKWHESETATLKAWQKFWNGTGNGIDVVNAKQVSTGSLGRQIQAVHGSFDNDATTIETTLQRVMGSKPAFAVEWLDY
jgi:hypothetical protein